MLLFQTFMAFQFMSGGGVVLSMCKLARPAARSILPGSVSAPAMVLLPSLLLLLVLLITEEGALLQLESEVCGKSRIPKGLLLVQGMALVANGPA